MSGVVIVTIISLAVVSLLVIGLTLFSYNTIIKSAKRLSASGALDEEFKKEIEENNKPAKKVLNIGSQVLSGILCVGFITLSLISGIYHIRGDQFTFNNQVSFVIASNSMSEYVDDDYNDYLVTLYAARYGVSHEQANKELKADQFDTGDLLTFDVIKSDEELVYYDVYGYKNSKGQIITHRFMGTNEDGSLIFRGDNTYGNDIDVNRDQVLYRYKGNNAKSIGLVVLFFGSGYGVYAIVAVICMFVIGDIAVYKWEKIKKNRLKEIGLYTEKPKEGRKKK